MAAKEICQNCEAIFIGGPKQFLCPKCLKEKQRQGGRESQRRRKEKKEVTMLKIIDADVTVQEVIDVNGGYCPCAIEKNISTLCPCKEFREQTEPGECRCGRYEKVEV